MLWSGPGRPAPADTDDRHLLPGQQLRHPAGDHRPGGTVPIFVAITADWDPRQRHRAAWQAVAVAALVIAAFALFGQQLLGYLGISVPSLQLAGGLLLLVVALDLLRGKLEGLSGAASANVAFVPLGTPLLAGPGAIAASMVFMRQAGRGDQRLGVALGLLGVLGVLGVALRFAGGLQRVLRRAGIELLTRISGLLLTAIAVQLVVDAVREFARAGL
jgi:multiple antibiotic resistance protein